MVSDAIAWLVVSTGVISAVIIPIVAPIHASHQRLIGEQPASFLFTVSTAVIALLSALGAYQLSRRRPEGLLLVMLPCLLWLASGQIYTVLVYGGIMLMTFGTPLFLSYLEARRVGRR